MDCLNIHKQALNKRTNVHVGSNCYDVTTPHHNNK